MKSSEIYFYQIHAVNELHNGHFGTYLEMLLDEEKFRSGQGRDSFYKSDTQVAKKLGMTRRTIIKYRALAEELRLCFISLSDFGYSQYRIYVDRINNFISDAYQIYMQRIRNREIQEGIRTVKKKAWEDLTNMINESFNKRCEMNSQGVCNEFTPYGNPNTVDLKNNNFPVVDSHLSGEKEMVQVSKEQESLVAASISESLNEDLDPDLFSIDLVHPLALALAQAFEKDKTAIQRYKKIGNEVGKWMVWHASETMRRGYSLEYAIAGTIKLVANKNHSFTKPLSLQKSQISKQGKK